MAKQPGIPSRLPVFLALPIHETWGSRGFSILPNSQDCEGLKGSLYPQKGGKMTRSRTAARKRLSEL